MHTLKRHTRTHCFVLDVKIRQSLDTDVSTITVLSHDEKEHDTIKSRRWKGERRRKGKGKGKEREMRRRGESKGRKRKRKGKVRRGKEKRKRDVWNGDKEDKR
jgi:hypothetical protein